ncbi:CocE/NonD family hydrolase [Prosthecobacter debontii]|uniref:CocE/NonD family hydrolase n=1 Tax=Prosthecobacter debontii TaxID=48467 RepID=UPI001FE2C5AB|nr:CocE/NonD family hydrolase [Prosthecobacter debontii]
MKSYVPILALLCSLCFDRAHADSAPLPPIDLQGVREQHVMIPMRDGVRLSAYVYLPEGEGKWPVVFEQRYASLTGSGTRKSSADLARRGYVVAMVNFRGSQQSEGTYVGYRALAWGELKDGYDTCEWLATQPWSTGKVGSFGSSQGGFAQNFLAVTRPPHLICQYMVDTGVSLFQEGYRIGGITRPLRFEAFKSNCRNPDDNAALLREWDQHPNYDAYWRAEDCGLHFDQMNVPCFTIGSWYDFMVQGSILSFQGRKPNATQQLLLGPWLHGRLNKGSKVGDLVYPNNATWPELEHMVRWFDHWLKGVDNGVEKEPAVRYYVMGAVGETNAPGNVWREASDWPPAATETSFYLHEGAVLKDTSPASATSGTSYDCDPLHPMEIPGRSFPGAKDTRAFDQQKEVRTWATEPLTKPLEITGAVQAELWVKSTAPDTDFIVRVSDVYPDGRSILIMDYPLRARYREGFDKQVLLIPGQPAQLKWRIGWTSIILNSGHRLQVTLSSTGAPLYEPNNQTGGKMHTEWMQETQTATHTILHEKEHPSRLLVPIVK